VFRVALSSHRFLHQEQLQQKRGLWYFVGRPGIPGSLVAGGERGFDSWELEVGGDLPEFLSGQLGELGTAFDDRVPAKLREPINRALMWMGSSLTRADLDDRVVDLCTALECLLALPKDGLKAEAIAVRYILVGFAIADSSYVVNPISIYDLYLLRNDIVHGSARRVAGILDYKDLRYVTRDALARVLKLYQDQPQIKSMSDLLMHIRTEDGLARVAAFVGQHNATSDAVKALGALASVWLDEAQSAARRGEPAG
jgi:hypothetical protein